MFAFNIGVVVIIIVSPSPVEIVLLMEKATNASLLPFARNGLVRTIGMTAKAMAHHLWPRPMIPLSFFISDVSFS